MAAAAVVLLAGAAGARLALHRGPTIVPSASLIAVLPFGSSVADTALTRLGRDLVFTVSANLDAVGEIRTVDAHTLLAQPANAAAGFSLPAGAALGRRFGAGSVVHGSVVRLGPQLVRLDFGLFTSDSLAPMARASVTAAPESVAVLTDSITRALLERIWRRGEPPTPSLDAALKTHSAPALRAFLEGERALVEYRLNDAAEAYSSAIAADSSFWLAYWRYAFSRGYWEGEDIDTLVVRAFRAHRAELPERDRASIEAFLTLGSNDGDSSSVALARARAVTERFPDYWFGWLVYGDFLVHWAPILGHRILEARVPLERAVDLNPRLVPAWEHLGWVYCKTHDAQGMARTLDALRRLQASPAMEHEAGLNELLQFELFVRLLRANGQVDRALLDSVARANASGGPATGMPGWCGFLRTQVEINRQILALRPRSEVASGVSRHLALVWAGRGAWDSVPGAMDRWAEHAPNDDSALERYALAVTGVWFGGLDVSEAAKRRGAAARMVDRVPPEQGQGDLRAWLVWLDGVLAWAQGDRTGLDAARQAVARLDADRPAGEKSGWARSLTAFQLALSGSTSKAGEALAALEWERAEYLGGATYLTALDRLSASRWLLKAGDTAQAARLLSWNEAWGGVSGGVGSTVFASLAYLERARLEEALGNAPLAREYYQEFMLRNDMPSPRLRHLVDEARSALARMSGQRDQPAEAGP